MRMRDGSSGGQNMTSTGPQVRVEKNSFIVSHSITAIAVAKHRAAARDGSAAAAADRGPAVPPGGQGAAVEVLEAAGVPATPDGHRVRQAAQVKNNVSPVCVHVSRGDWVTGFPQQVAS